MHPVNQDKNLQSAVTAQVGRPRCRCQKSRGAIGGMWSGAPRRPRKATTPSVEGFVRREHQISAAQKHGHWFELVGLVIKLAELGDVPKVARAIAGGCPSSDWGMAPLGLGDDRDFARGLNPPDPIAVGRWPRPIPLWQHWCRAVTPT